MSREIGQWGGNQDRGGKAVRENGKMWGRGSRGFLAGGK